MPPPLIVPPSVCAGMVPTEDGEPSAPPFTTNAPSVPTATASAVATLVPSPETPVEIGRPVALVSVPLEGVPSTGVTSVGDVARTKLPLPVVLVNVATPVAKSGTPDCAEMSAPKPPRAAASVPDHPTVIEVAFTNAVVGDPPSVSVTLVSFVRVSAAALEIAEAGILVNVFDPPSMLFPVNVSVVVRPTNVSVAFGNDHVPLPAVAGGAMVTKPLVDPASSRLPEAVPGMPSLNLTGLPPTAK